MTVEVKHVSKSYNGKEVLSDFSLEISSDDTYLLMGPEGCGKTTLLRIICGLENPDRGAVSLLGDYKYDRVNVGMVFQDDRLLEDYCAIENVACMNSRLSEKVAREELLKLLPESALYVPVKELCEVERKVVEIIRASIVPSDMLLLDDPFHGMNEEQVHSAFSYIKKKAGHKGILIAQRNEFGLERLRKVRMG